MPLENNGTVWIEAKLPQTYFSQSQTDRDNRSLYKKHMFHTSAAEHSALHDVNTKLTSLIGKFGVSYIGFLLVILYSDRYPLPDSPYSVNDFKKLTGLDKSPWIEHVEPEWRNPNIDWEKCYMIGYYWERPAI